MFTVLMIYLAVAPVRFVIVLIGHIRSPDPAGKYSRSDILAECTSVALLWPVVDGVLLFFRVGDWFFYLLRDTGPTCGFCNAYYYRQTPGYFGPEKELVKANNTEEESECLPSPEQHSSKKTLDKL